MQLVRMVSRGRPARGTPFLTVYLGRLGKFGIGPKHNVRGVKGWTEHVGFSGRLPGGWWACSLWRR